MDDGEGPGGQNPPTDPAPICPICNTRHTGQRPNQPPPVAAVVTETA